MINKNKYIEVRDSIKGRVANKEIADKLCHIVTLKKNKKGYATKLEEFENTCKIPEEEVEFVLNAMNSIGIYMTLKEEPVESSTEVSVDTLKEHTAEADVGAFEEHIVEVCDDSEDDNEPVAGLIENEATKESNDMPIRENKRSVSSNKGAVANSKKKEYNDALPVMKVVSDDYDPTEAELNEVESETEPVETDKKIIDEIYTSTDDSVKMYISEIAQYNLLTHEEEIELSKKIHAKKMAEEQLAEMRAEYPDMCTDEVVAELEGIINEGDKARTHMINCNLRLVVSVAKKFNWSGIDILDLIQEGNFGMMRAVDKYDWTKGHKFSTYATWWIRQSISRSISDKGSLIRIPVHMSEMKTKVNRAKNELHSMTGRVPTEAEIAKHVGMDVAKVREILNMVSDPISIDTPVGDDGDGTIGEFISDNNADDPFEITSREILKETMSEVINKVLDPREAKTIRMRFGFEDGRIRTLEEVGAMFNVTRERVRQIEERAIRKLRNNSRSKALVDYIKN